MPTVEIYTGEPRQAKIKEVKLRLKDVHIKLKDFRLIDKGANIGYGLELDEDMSRHADYGRSFTEGIELKETKSKELSKIVYIDFKVEELLTKLFTKYVEENAEFDESLVKEANKFVSDALELKESLAKDVEMTVKYNLELKELKEKFVEKFFTNKVELQESLSKAYELNLKEVVELKETKSKELSKIVYIDFKVEELLTKLFTKYVEENAEFDESLVKEANKFVSDALELKESLAKDVEMTVKYNLELKELKEKFVEKFFTNKVELQESLSKAYELNLKEVVELKETKSKELSKTFNEVLNIIEIYLRHAGTVMSDLTIYAKALNETDFDVAITPAGYDRFKTMLTGDYIYQRALFRFVLNAATVNSERPNAREYLHKVDVPDTIETGIIEFKTGENPATYYFTREFHVVPEVTFTILRVENMEELGQAVILPLEVNISKHSLKLEVFMLMVQFHSQLKDTKGEMVCKS